MTDLTRECCGTEYNAFHTDSCPKGEKRRLEQQAYPKRTWTTAAFMTGLGASTPGSDSEAREDTFEARVEAISDWWTSHVAAVIEKTAPKAVEYGASDLDLMGQAMQASLPIPAEWTLEEKAEFGRYAACAFYALGKVARIFGALEQGRLPNPDSEFDLEVYSIMMARIRETGRWV